MNRLPALTTPLVRRLAAAPLVKVSLPINGVLFEGAPPGALVNVQRD